MADYGTSRAFSARSNPSPDSMIRLEEAEPANPFCSAAYALGRASLGWNPCLFTMADGTRGEKSFYGYLRNARIGRVLEITSAPLIANPIAFVEGLASFCSRNSVTELEVNTFGSPSQSIPTFPRETSRCTRTEFIIDLGGEQLLPSMSRDHKQRIKRAERSGLVLRRSTDEAACVEHARLIGASMARREDRGEHVSTAFPLEPLFALLKSGAGEIFQIVGGDRVLSSMLLLRSRTTAYDHTSGSSAEGMSTGAARFVIYRACQELRSEGLSALNLGGVREHESGLRAFKEHFGARAVSLDMVTAEFSTPLVRLARHAVRLLRGSVRVVSRAGRTQ